MLSWYGIKITYNVMMLRWFGAKIYVTSHVPGKSIFDERTKLSFYFFSLSGYWDDIFNHTLQSDWIRNKNQEKTILKVCCENKVKIKFKKSPYLVPQVW
jgi:hypothetical protein